MLGRIRSARRAASSLHLTPGSSSNSRSTASAAAVHRQLLQHRPTVATALPSSSSHFFSTTTAPLSSAFLKSYDEHVAERAAMANGKLGGIAPKPLDAAQTATLIEELRAVSSASSPEAERLVELLSHRVPPGVDEAAYVKAAYLSAVALGKESPTLISRLRAVESCSCTEVSEMEKKIAGQRAQIESQQKEIDNQQKDLRMLREAVKKIQKSQDEAATTIASDSESAEYEGNTDAQQLELVDYITMPCGW